MSILDDAGKRRVIEKVIDDLRDAAFRLQMSAGRLGELAGDLTEPVPMSLHYSSLQLMELVKLLEQRLLK